MRRANRPMTDDSGEISVTIDTVTFDVVQDTKKLRQGLAPDECRYEAYDITYQCEGLGGDFTIKDRMGAVLNGEPVATKYRGKTKTYNKLTTFLLSTGLVTIEGIDDVDTDKLHEQVLALAGSVWKCNLVKVEGFFKVDISTLRT